MRSTPTNHVSVARIASREEAEIALALMWNSTTRSLYKLLVGTTVNLVILDRVNAPSGGTWKSNPCDYLTRMSTYRSSRHVDSNTTDHLMAQPLAHAWSPKFTATSPRNSCGSLRQVDTNEKCNHQRRSPRGPDRETEKKLPSPTPRTFRSRRKLVAENATTLPNAKATRYHVEVKANVNLA